MRFLVATALLLALLSTSAMADMLQGNNGSNNSNGSSTSRVYASATCSPHVWCPDSTSEAPTTSELAVQGSACISQYLGYHNPDGFFSDMAGLDYNNCLTPLPNAMPKGIGGQLIPKCCIVKGSDNLCNFHCDLISQ